MDIAVRWTAFPLHPETPDEGRSLEDLFAGRAVDIDAVVARLKRTASDLGLPLAERRMTYNSRRAQELGKWAEENGRGEAFHRQVFDAYFARARNIARIDVLKETAAAAGLDPLAAEEMLLKGRYKAAVDRDWQRCRSMGISAVPTFHMAGRLLVGAHPYAEILKLALAAGAAPK